MEVDLLPLVSFSEFAAARAAARTVFNHVFKYYLKVSVDIPVIFLTLGAILLDSRPILLAGQIWVFITPESLIQCPSA